MFFNFDVTRRDQIACKITDLEVSVCKKLYLSSREVSWIRLTGLPVGVLTTCLKSAGIVSSVAEGVFKGVCNIIGSPFSDRCSFLTGLKFTFITPAVYLVFWLPLRLVIDTVNSFILGYQAIKNPEEAYGEMLREFDEGAYRESRLRINVDENNPATLCALGHNLCFGEVTDAKLEEAQRLFERAVELNHIEGYHGLSTICSRRGLEQQADEYLKKFNQALRSRLGH